MQHRITNALSVDVEDYFQVWSLSSHFPPSSWDAQPRRIERNMDRILTLFSDRGVKATFFTLGWVAERHPAMVKRIVAEGHELASHGYAHQRADEQPRNEFATDIRRAKMLLEDISGAAVNGYRAPSFSIGAGNLWALDEIQAAGYTYSSSIYPVKHDHYGIPDAPRSKYQSRPGLTELPVTTVKLLGRNMPAGGGGYFRFLPYTASRWLIQRVNERDQMPGIFYMHPWEIDPDQPRVSDVPWKSRFRHYVNLHRTEDRLKRLLQDFRWDRVDRAFGLAGQAGRS